MKNKLAYALASLFLFWLALVPAKAKEIPIGKNGIAWKISAKHTNKGENFRFSEFRRYRKDGTYIVLYDGKGKLNKKQLAMFRRLWNTDTMIIPDSLITVREFQANSQTLEELCTGFGNPKGCVSSLAAKNGLTKKASLHKKLSGAILVPKSYLLATKLEDKKEQSREQKKSSDGKKNAHNNFGALGITLGAAIVIFCMLFWRYGKDKLKLYLSIIAWSPVWHKFATGNFIPRPLYDSSLYKDLCGQSNYFLGIFHKRRQPEIFTGEQSLYWVNFYVNKIIPRATIHIRSNIKAHPDRPIHKFLAYAEDEVARIFRLTGTRRPDIDFKTTIKGNAVVIRIFAKKTKKKEEGYGIQNAQS